MTSRVWSHPPQAEKLRETGGIDAKAGFEVHAVVNILHRAWSMVTEPQGLMLPTDPGHSGAKTCSRQIASIKNLGRAGSSDQSPCDFL